MLLGFSRGYLPAAEKTYTAEEIEAQGEPPVAEHKPAPNYPEQLRRASRTGAVELEVTVETSGDPVQIEVLRSTDRDFELSAIQAAQKWRFTPGKIGGRNVRSRVREIVSFGGGTLPVMEPATPRLALVGGPILLDWVQPDYPQQARKEKREGTVKAEFVVERDGTVSREKVSESTDDGFNEAALAAVRQWRFKPALENGEAVASAMHVTVGFDLDQGREGKRRLQPPPHLQPLPMKETPALAEKDLDPSYPVELEDRMLPGMVEVEFVVEEDGRVANIKVLRASHPAFVETAVGAVLNASFTPAKQGPLAKKSLVRYPVGFESLRAKPSEILKANSLTVIGEVNPASPPIPQMLIRPVLSRDRLLAGEEGKAVAEFTVDPEGRVHDITVVAADHPDFGAAMRAAVETWLFRPAQGETGPVSVRVRATEEFTVAQRPAERRLAGLLKPGAAGVGGPAGLDRKPQPLWRGFPVYPHDLRELKQKGGAQIEFIIDRDGRVRLPKIVSASAESFGWAAATAVSQWVFEQPMRQGQPVDIVVRVPVNFEPPR